MEGCQKFKEFLTGWLKKRISAKPNRIVPIFINRLKSIAIDEVKNHPFKIKILKSK